MDESQGTGRITPDDLREVSFPQARRGYDREAVHAFLERVADLVGRGTNAVREAGPDVQREIERIGERTAGILSAAEDAAAKVRAEANDYATQIREAAEQESRKARLTASNKAEEIVAEAEARAERIIEQTITRRRRLNQAISSLVDRRDEIAEETQRLADELLSAVEALRTTTPVEEGDAAGIPPMVGQQPALEPEFEDDTELVPEDERETELSHEDESRPEIAGENGERVLEPEDTQEIDAINRSLQ